MTMVVIGFDRYNVIVKGFSGTKITGARAAGILVILWAYSIIGCCPPFFGWGGYALGKFGSEYNSKRPMAKSSQAQAVSFPRTARTFTKIMETFGLNIA